MRERGRLLAPEHPRALALLRISVTGILLVSPETYSAERIATLPPALWSVPEGLGWFARHVPITPAIASGVHWVLIASAVSGLMGFCSRAALLTVALSGLYVLGVYQLTGSVTHDMHLVWFALLLSTGPCGAVWSVDRVLAARRGSPVPGPSMAAAVPLLCARVLLGLVYFFPGFWKLRSSGLAWITSDNLQNQMYWKWYQHGALPPIRIDRWERLLHAGALGVVLLELGFVGLVLFPRGRTLAALGGLLFHAFSQLFLFIPFSSLWGCYTMLLPAPRAAQESAPGWSSAARLSAVLGTLLVVAVCIQGARNQVQAWPFACYPTFQWRAGPTIPDLVLEAVRADGATRVLPDGPGAGGARSQDEWGMAWNVAGAYGHPPTPGRLAAYLTHARRKPAVEAALQDAVRIRFYRAWYSVKPEDSRRPPLRADLIGELDAR